MINKDLVPKLCKPLIQFDIKNFKKKNLKIGRRREQTFSQGYTDGQQAYGKMLSTVSHQEMQIRTTVRFTSHLSEGLS